jgi:excisionase family DNA binding protein
VNHSHPAPKQRPTKLVTPPANAVAYRVNTACDMLGIGRATLYKAINEGKLRSIKVLGRTVIPRSEIERLAANGTEA